METRRWTNPSQPQTLRIAVFLLYLQTAFTVIGLGFSPYLLVGSIGYLPVIGFAVAAFGIANEQKWGYALGAALAAGEVLLYILFLGFDVLQFGILISFMFSVALAALLLHPQSRDYQRIWFR